MWESLCDALRCFLGLFSPDNHLAPFYKETETQRANDPGKLVSDRAGTQMQVRTYEVSAQPPILAGEAQWVAYLKEGKQKKEA